MTTDNNLNDINENDLLNINDEIVEGTLAPETGEEFSDDDMDDEDLDDMDDEDLDDEDLDDMDDEDLDDMDDEDLDDMDDEDLDDEDLDDMDDEDLDDMDDEDLEDMDDEDLEDMDDEDLEDMDDEDLEDMDDEDLDDMDDEDLDDMDDEDLEDMDDEDLDDMDDEDLDDMDDEDLDDEDLNDMDNEDLEDMDDEDLDDMDDEDLDDMDDEDLDDMDDEDLDDMDDEDLDDEDLDDMDDEDLDDEDLEDMDDEDLDDMDDEDLDDMDDEDLDDEDLDDMDDEDLDDEDLDDMDDEDLDDMDDEDLDDEDIDDEELEDEDLEIDGVASIGEILTVDVPGDDDNADSSPVSYQWYRDGEEIEGATSENYELTEEDLDAEISVQVTYTNNTGEEESLTSEETQTIVSDGEEISGIVQDGYVAGAAIYIDKNGNNLPDADEATGIFTDENGRFSGTIAGSGSIIAVGGTNTDTGLANKMILAAPEGSGVISPITTLLESMIDDSNLTEEEAEAQLTETLGLAENIDLNHYDPLNAEEGDNTAVDIQKVNVQLAVAATLAEDTTEVMSGLAEEIIESVETVDLSDSDLLNEALDHIEIDDDLITAIAEANAEVGTSDSLSAIAEAQKEATQETTDNSSLSELTYAETVQKIYVAYYGRPADTGGLQYWNDRLEAAEGNLNEIIDAYGSSTEFTERYGDLSNSELIDTVYQQMFGREPDEGGKAFYLEKLDAGEMTLQSITLNVLDGAQNEDLTIISNKVSSSSYFTDNLDSNGFVYEGSSAAELAKNLLDEVGIEDESLNQQVDGFLEANNTLLGSWIVDAVEGADEAGVITFFSDNSFLYSIFNENQEDSSNLEQGSYNWDAMTGSFSFDLSVDNNTDSGLSADITDQITRDANKLAMANLSLSKVDNEDGSIIGSWYSESDNGLQVITFMENGQFVVSQATDNEGTAETGVESGSYIWFEETGAFNFNVEYDSNGREGFSHSGANEVTLVGNQLHLTNDDGTDIFNGS